MWSGFSFLSYFLFLAGVLLAGVLSGGEMNLNERNRSVIRRITLHHHVPYLPRIIRKHPKVARFMLTVVTSVYNFSKDTVRPKQLIETNLR